MHREHEGQPESPTSSHKPIKVRASRSARSERTGKPIFAGRHYAASQARSAAASAFQIRAPYIFTTSAQRLRVTVARIGSNRVRTHTRFNTAFPLCREFATLALEADRVRPDLSRSISSAKGFDDLAQALKFQEAMMTLARRMHQPPVRPCRQTLPGPRALIRQDTNTQEPLRLVHDMSRKLWIRTCRAADARFSRIAYFPALVD